MSLDPGAVIEPHEAASHPLAWLLATLRQATEELMAGDATPLQKANAMSRLGGLYLKAYQTSALEQENRALKEQVAELEKRLAGADEEIAHMHEVAAEWVEWLERTDPTAHPWRERAGLPHRDPAADAAAPGGLPQDAAVTPSRFSAIQTVVNPTGSGIGAGVADPP